jgi:2-(acetamidomethylene)succinate hydrolase
MKNLDWHEGVARSMERDGILISYVEGGRKEAACPTVLFVHGLTASARSWDPLIPRLAERCHVVSVDLRGHGKSGWAGKRTDGYRTSEFAKDLVHLIEVIGRGPVHLAGHSLGARIGIVLAGESPEHLASLVLSDTLPEVAKTGAIFVRDLILTRTGMTAYRSVEEGVQALRASDPDDEWREGQYEHYLKSITVPNWVGKLTYSCDPQLYWITTGSASRQDDEYFWQMAAAITCPTLILWGERSYLVTPELVERMLAVTSSAKAISFPCGHQLLRVCPDQWVDAVLDHVAEVESPQ